MQTKKRASAEYANAKEQGSETHWQVSGGVYGGDVSQWSLVHTTKIINVAGVEVAERILFIYAKLNPGVKYVQVSVLNFLRNVNYKSVGISCAANEVECL